MVTWLDSSMIHNLNSVVKYGVNSDKEYTRLQRLSVETRSKLVKHTWLNVWHDLFPLVQGCVYVSYFLSYLNSPDYTLQGTTGTIIYTFSPNVSQQCTTIQTLEDTLSEPPETLSLRMVNQCEELIVLSPATTTVTITRKWIYLW